MRNQKCDATAECFTSKRILVPMLFGCALDKLSHEHDRFTKRSNMYSAILAIVAAY
jgi:hypothetical protein